MNKIYEYEDLGLVFPHTTECKIQFIKALTRRTAAKIFGGIALGAGVTTVLFGVICEGLGCIVAVPPALIGAVSGITSVIILESYKSTRNKSIDILNGSLSQSKLDIQQSSSISIGASQNGIGVFYHF